VIEPAQKLEELLMPMAFVALAHHASFQDLQGGKQRRRADDQPRADDGPTAKSISINVNPELRSKWPIGTLTRLRICANVG
jgi:hypothetical protein